jgi:hypothetical protein
LAAAKGAAAAIAASMNNIQHPRSTLFLPPALQLFAWGGWVMVIR